MTEKQKAQTIFFIIRIEAKSLKDNLFFFCSVFIYIYFFQSIQYLFKVFKNVVKIEIIHKQIFVVGLGTTAVSYCNIVTYLIIETSK